MWVAAALLVASVDPCDAPAGEVSASIELPYAAFDGQPGPYGWRSLLEAGCVDAAVRLLAAYATANDAGLNQEQRLEMQFHIGQSLAMSGREEESIPYFVRSSAPDAPAEWRTYVEATLAFLRRDTASLAAARIAYARIAPDSMRLRFIDGMVACPGEPYAQAVHCKM